jgi:signal transduction histidine kinase
MPLHVLKPESARSDDLEPQPGVGRIPELVEEMTRLGLPVELKIEGRPRPLPSTADLSTYRIVQEALTNTLKHAGPVPTSVRFCFEPTALLVEVIDAGGRERIAQDGQGHGLLGMRERVALCGGELQAGPRKSGGFSIQAKLPRGEQP